MFGEKQTFVNSYIKVLKSRYQSQSHSSNSNVRWTYQTVYLLLKLFLELKIILKISKMSKQNWLWSLRIDVEQNDSSFKISKNEFQINSKSVKRNDRSKYFKTFFFFVNKSNFASFCKNWEKNSSYFDFCLSA